MTTTEEEATENEKQTTEVRIEKISSIPKILPKEIMDIMEYLSRKSNIMFKSQQRDEPELLETEKLKVALDAYQRNPQTFLVRFGNFLQDYHLQDFAKYSIADGDEEMILMVEDYQNKLKTRQRDIKNRRYTALQKLIKEGEYFSEQEMMKRQPELYQELVGQYLSDKEKKQRDCYDVKKTTFSGILMHSLEQKQLNDIMEKVQNDTLATSITEESKGKDFLDNLEKDAEVPLNCRQQWGNFDNEQIACSSSKKLTENLFKNKRKMTPVLDLIMADERELLRQEFVSQMHEQFLSGQDNDFDYSTVDDNTQYDDLNLINQDKEDKYFDESDDSSTKPENQSGIIHSHNKMEDDGESEDELDAFMSHLNKHHSLQKSIKNGANLEECENIENPT